MSDTTDRELLEAAAKAAGIVGRWERDKSFVQERWYFNVPYDSQNMLSGFEWNPLKDDGDALRLAVKLRIEVSARALTVAAHNWNGSGAIDHKTYCQEHFSDSDPYAATRRAITRAAAALGGNT